LNVKMPGKIVDGYRFLPPTLRSLLKKEIPVGEFQGEIPWTPLNGPVSSRTFSLVTSAGISLKSQPPFDMEREKREPFWGDPTLREIPRDTSQDLIAANHLHVDTSFALEDINVILPLERFSEFEREGIIGSLARTCFSIYGYQHDLSFLLNETLPRIAAKMHGEGVEAVVITPGCPLCCRTVGFLARYLESQGFSTLCLTMIPEFSRKIGIPRVAAIEYPFGRPVGQVHDRQGQHQVLQEALSCLGKASRPGEVFHLPFTWPEDPKETKWHPPEISPILKLFREERKRQ
jgi:D-proline reductase (dithiol) PrdB